MLVTAICAPLMVYGPQVGHSVYFNISWGGIFSEQLFAGEFYPRWLMGLNIGAGSPVFFFYGPAPFYFSAFGTALCEGCTPSVQLGIGQYLIIVLSSLTFYLYMRGHVGRWPAALGAFLYGIAPYHLSVDVLVRQAMGEFTTYLFLPLCFLAVDRISRDRSGLVLLAVSYALLVMSHIPSALLASPLILLYATLVFFPGRKGKHLFEFSGGILLGILLASCYLLPAIFDQENVWISKLWGDYYDYSKWFLLDGVEAPDPGMEARLGQITLSGSVVMMVSLVLAYSKNSKIRQHIVAVFGVYLSTWFLLTPLSSWVWEYAPFLKKVQFPWRVIVVQEWSVVVVLCIAFSRALEEPRWRLLPAIVLVVACCAGANYLAQKEFSRHEGLLENPHNQRKLAAGANGNFDVPEYLPIGVRVERKVALSNVRRMPMVVYESGLGVVEVQHWEPRDIRLNVKLERDTPVVLRHFYYPGWRAVRSDTGESIRVGSHDPLGLIAFLAPAGDYGVSIELTSRWPERLGWWLSTLGALVCLTLAWLKYRQRNTFKTIPSSARSAGSG
ncbi:MAG: hypothetical protein ABJN62_14460 [Halioglobus sp.]